jgi:mycofactocin glycosyltransferase
VTETRAELAAGARRSRAAHPSTRTAAGPKPPAPVPLPAGFGIELDAATKRLSDGSLFGGSPARVLRLTPAGDRVLAALKAGPVRSAQAGALARRLTDAGLAHPVPPSAGPPGARAALPVSVIIPVRDRTAMLGRCLAALGAEYPVVVVDDGSADPRSVAAVVARHGATLCRRERTGGPAAARNTGLAAIRTELVAFLDSDCVPPSGWIERLAAHLADPLVGAVAPRVVTTSPVGAPTAAARYATACGSLDLGDRPARVAPRGRVAYVPTAALLVRRAALDGFEPGRDVFDPALRYGEDVDLVWRLHDAGWRIRYEPAVQLPHEGPPGWPGLLAKRFSYGTSAAPLARRHPANMAPLVLQPWPAAATAALLARKPLLALAAAAGGWLDLTTQIRQAGIPADGAPAATVTAVTQTWLGVGRYATQFAAPLLATVMAAPGGRTPARRWGRRAAAASLLAGPVITAYRQRRPELDPVRFTLAHIADDVCYGAGVWAGCARERTLRPVRPLISWRPLGISRPPAERSELDG